MTPTQKQTLATLAMARALPDFTLEKVPPGRLRNRYLKLITEVDKELRKLPRATPADMDELGAKLGDWGKSTGWLGKERHVCTITSFLLAILTDYMPTAGRVIETVEDIYDYFDRAKKVPAPSTWAGTSAYLKWIAMFGEPV